MNCIVASPSVRGLGALAPMSRRTRCRAIDRRRKEISAVAVVRVDAELLQLAMQRAALHPDELCGAADVAAEAQQLRLEVLGLEQVPRLAQRQAHDVGARVDGEQ